MASASVFRLSCVATMRIVVFLQFGWPLGDGIEPLVTAGDLPLKTTLTVDRRAIEDKESRKLDQYWIGYTEFRTNLKGGRHPNQATMRACSIKADGTERRILAEELAKDANTWTQFVDWSPDGQMAILCRGSNTPDNAALEEKERSFRFRDRTNDCFLLDLATGKAINLSAVERVSNYNGNLFFWPGNPQKLGFDALIDGNSHPFSMDRPSRLHTHACNQIQDTVLPREHALRSGAGRSHHLAMSLRSTQLPMPGNVLHQVQSICSVHGLVYR